MAVFWFGWTKKLKNIFTKKEADALYLQKNSNQLQQVNGLVDFHNNVVCKQNGYVDNVDTNGPTSMINKRYLEEQTLSKTATGTQTVAGQVVFSKTGEVIKINSNSDTATYLSGYKSNNQRVWFFGKGSSNDNHVRIGADIGDIKFEPNGNVDVSNKKIVNVADPVNLQDVANKRYTVNSKKYNLYWQDNNTVFNNLDSHDINITFTTIDTTVPWILKYDRIVKNGNVYEGSFNYTFMIPELNEALFSTNRWYYSQSTTNFEEGSRVGIMIKRKTANTLMLKIQIWENTKAIKNIKLYRPQQ